MIGLQRSGSMPTRLGQRGQAAAIGRPPAARLAATALAMLAVAVLALAGLGRATVPRDEAGVSLAVAGRAGAVTVRNGDTAPFHGSLVIGSGAAARTVAVDLGAGAAADFSLPAGVACRGSLEVRLADAGGASSSGTQVMLRLPCASQTP